jgi:hypothetical protein
MTTKDQAIAQQKLTVTLQDSPVDIELNSYKRMLEAACVDLGLINEALGLDPNDGGAEPILDAIAELKQSPAPDCRTCERLHKCSSPLNPVKNCTNGDKYQPAPAVVLWRTE